MDGTNHSRGSTIQSLSPDKREDLEHELRPEALASIAREETFAEPQAHEISTNTTHAAVSPKTTRASETETTRAPTETTRAETACCGRGVAAAVTPESRAKLLMLDDAAHMTIFSHPTRIAEAVDELWGGALRYEEEL